MFNILPVSKYLGVRMEVNGMTLTSTFLIYPPIVFLSNSIRMLVNTFARSTREAGTYLPFIALIASLPGLALALFPVKSTYWAMLIPIFEQQLLINQFIR